MDAKRRICVVTGSRAEYGLLFWIIHDLSRDPEVELQLVVTGMHLSPEFGRTVQVIEQDGFPIAERVETLVSSDGAAGITKSIGLGVMGFGDAFVRLRPDIIVLLGDRFEIFAAAQAALVLNVPVAHIAGGDTTEGSIDEAMRHSITKMAHIHFVTNEQAARRVRQMGEDPASVHVVGSPGLDNLRRMDLLDRKRLAQQLGCHFRKHNLLVTFHPVTLEPVSGRDHFDVLLKVLAGLGSDFGLFFTRPNADAGGRIFSQMLDAWAAGRDNVHVSTSLGQLHYLSLLAHVDAMVGNSSSGLYEAPSLHVPTVDIGDRQRGRLASDSVIHCEPTSDAIRSAINEALHRDCSRTVNPYGDGRSTERIIAELKRVPEPQRLLKKRFHLMETGNVEP
jgi:UDP-hydrolysing UDP-N-acetyl-D-glucosamine 2-epimerase